MIRDRVVNLLAKLYPSLIDTRHKLNVWFQHDGLSPQSFKVVVKNHRRVAIVEMRNPNGKIIAERELLVKNMERADGASRYRFLSGRSLLKSSE